MRIQFTPVDRPDLCAYEIESGVDCIFLHVVAIDSTEPFPPFWFETLPEALRYIADHLTPGVQYTAEV